MLRFVRFILFFSIGVNACAPVPSLWGQYASPTPVQESAASSYPVTPGAVLESPGTAAGLSVFTPMDLREATSEPSPTTVSSPAPSATATSAPPASPTPSALITPSAATTPHDPATLQADPAAGLDAMPEAAITMPTFDVPPVFYTAQSGDSLQAVASRFGIDPSEIRAELDLPESGFVPPGTLLILPNRLSGPTSPSNKLLPDSEVVFSATAIDFDIDAYIQSAGGLLSTHREYLGSTGWNTGPDEIRRLTFENSINPRLLLALLEYESRWVRGDSVDVMHRDYPMGYVNPFYKGLFLQLLWTVNQLSTAYYGWRAGTLTELQFPDGTKLRLDPQLNAGTVAMQYLFSRQHGQSEWARMIDPGNGFLALYADMFGDPWVRAETVDPVLPPGLVQPALEFPFEPDVAWSYSGGPHGAWEHDGALAAIDFAPFTDHGGCDPTPTWVTAAASGMVVRAERGVVVQDLDGDGFEQTGWALVYLHIASSDRVKAGTYLQRDDRIGHASCEGGQTTGTHLHFVRKYNGEWIAADGPIPFILSGWAARAGSLPYQGTLVNGQRVVTADPNGQWISTIVRSPDDD